MRQPGRPAAEPDSSPRDRIVAAARGQFFAHGLRSVTMADLAASLGMSKKTLYAYFPSKTSLLEALLTDKFRDIESDLAQIAVKRPQDVMTAIRQLLATVQRHASEIQPAFLRDLQRTAPEVFQMAEKRRRQVIQTHLGKLLAAGRRAGVIRKDVPEKLVIEIILGAARAMLLPETMRNLGTTPTEAFSAIMTVILEGVIVRRGKGRAKP